MGVDIPDDPDRNFIIEELLEIASTDDDDSDSSAETDFPVVVESVPLPRQYNITFIEVMIRDPLWAFVFWEIKALDKEQFEKAPDFTGYSLRVSPCGIKTDNVFSVSVKPDDTAWYLGLTPDAAEEISGQEQIQYRVELCACHGGGETVLAVSNPVRLPGLPELRSGTGKQENEAHCAWGNQLVRLSGYGDFHIIRRNERPPRIKRGESAGS